MRFWFFLQSHSFTVTSWTEGKQDFLDLLIEPRGGLTQIPALRSKAARKPGRNISPYLALFIGVRLSVVYRTPLDQKSNILSHMA